LVEFVYLIACEYLHDDAKIQKNDYR